MRYYSRPLKSVWFKAAAIGSFWGATELILGSYLHNLHVPMSGTIMSFLVIVFLTIFASLWKEPWLALRASIIAALIKSISPSAVLIGPMTAIILEGFLFDVGVWLLGRNLFGFIFAGMLVEMSILVHKIISLLILYGSDLIRISENFYLYVVRLIGIKGIPPLQALYLLFLIFGIIGLIAALIGYYYALAVKRSFSKADVANFKVKNVKPFEVKDDRFVVLKLLGNLVATSLIIIALRALPLYYSVPLLLSYWAVLYYFYPQAFRYFSKIFLWVQLAIFWVLAVFFYAQTKHFDITLDEIFIGLRLILRALVIIIFFAVLSIQIRTPLIKSFLLRRGFTSLYLTLKLASSTLPQFVDIMTKKGLDKRIFRRLIYATINLVYYFEKKIKYRTLFVVEGERGAGKTSFMMELAQKLNDYGIIVGGIFTVKDKKADGSLDYLVTNITKDQKVLLCTSRPVENYYYKTKNFYFLKQGVKFGNLLIRENFHSLVIMIDEVGILELNNLGWDKTLETMFNLNKNMVWSVRKRYVKQLLGKYYVNEAIIFDIEIDTPQLAAKTIVQKIFYKYD